MSGTRPLTPGRTYGRETQRAIDVVAGASAASTPGEHSVWCDVVLVERGCRPLLARGVVVVLTESKVFLRVAATAFTLTVHLQDVVQVRHVVPKHVVELHVRLPGTPAGVSQRLYRLEVAEVHSDLSHKLFCLLVDVLPFSLERQSAQKTFTDDAVAAYLVDAPCSMLPLELLQGAGLQEIHWVLDQRGTSTLPASAPPRVTSGHLTETSVFQPLSPASRDSSHVTSSHYKHARGLKTTGHLQKVYVAPSPSFWRLPTHASPSLPSQDARLTWSSACGCATPSEASAWPSSRERPSTAGAHEHGEHRRGRVHRTAATATNITRDVVDMSSRESSFVADMCGLRPLTTRDADPSASSRTSHQTDRTLHVQYGQVISG